MFTDIVFLIGGHNYHDQINKGWGLLVYMSARNSFKIKLYFYFPVYKEHIQPVFPASGVQVLILWELKLFM